MLAEDAEAKYGDNRKWQGNSVVVTVTSHPSAACFTCGECRHKWHKRDSDITDETRPPLSRSAVLVPLTTLVFPMVGFGSFVWILMTVIARGVTGALKDGSFATAGYFGKQVST